MISKLPPAHTPLNQHSLAAIEQWLHELGAKKSDKNPCVWLWVQPLWSAELFMEKECLQVIWQKEGKRSQLSFSYALSRSDIQDAIFEGP